LNTPQLGIEGEQRAASSQQIQDQRFSLIIHPRLASRICTPIALLRIGQAIVVAIGVGRI
jgi:hypothetical protein